MTSKEINRNGLLLKIVQVICVCVCVCVCVYLCVFIVRVCVCCESVCFGRKHVFACKCLSVWV